jgi:hypothetical protein
MSQLTVAFILGEGYSGSTLVDLLLGSHSQMVGLGEVDAEAFDAFFDDNQICTCLLGARDCHFWSKVLSRLTELTGREVFRLGEAGSDPEMITQNTIDLFRAVRDVSSVDILVDSSKRFQRTYSLAKSGVIRPKVIHLVRDGRGVAYSYSKRGKPFRDAVLQWQTTNAQIKDWLESGNAPESIAVRYEHLCEEPVKVVRDICEFLGINWEAQMMLFGRKTHHNVRGNTMRFRTNNSTIKLDETWKEKVEENDLRWFKEVTGCAATVPDNIPEGVENS